MNTFAATLIIIGMAYGLPLWAALIIQSVVWLVMLLPHTWRDYLASRSLYRVAHGCTVVLPSDEDERRNEPDAERVVALFLALPGTTKNFILAQLVATFYFRVMPRPIRWRLWMKGWKVRYEIRQGDVGLTKLLNRMVDTYPPGNWRHDLAQAVRKRWLNRYDPRALHT